MNSDQARQLQLMAKAIGPQRSPGGAAEAQAITMTWSLALADVDYSDALAAVGQLARTVSVIEPKDIVAEVRRIRDGRMPDTLPEPNVDPDDVEGWRREAAAIAAQRAAGAFNASAYAAGGFTLTGAPPRYALGGEQVHRQIEVTVRGVPG